VGLIGHDRPMGDSIATQSGHRCRLVKIFPERGLSPVKARH